MLCLMSYRHYLSGKGFFCRTVFHLGSPQHVLIPGIPSQVQDCMLLVEHHYYQPKRGSLLFCHFWFESLLNEIKWNRAGYLISFHVKFCEYIQQRGGQISELKKMWLLKLWYICRLLFKQFFKPDSKHTLLESVILLFKKKSPKLSPLQLSRISLTQKGLHFFSRLLQSNDKLVIKCLSIFILPNMFRRWHLGIVR